MGIWEKKADCLGNSNFMGSDCPVFLEPEQYDPNPFLRRVAALMLRCCFLRGTKPICKAPPCLRTATRLRNL